MRAETACVGNYSEIEVAECHFSSFHLLSTLVAIFTPTSPSSYPRPLFEGRLTPPTCPWEHNGSIHRSRDPQQSLAPDPIHPMRQIQHLELLSTGAAAISLVIDRNPHLDHGLPEFSRNRFEGVMQAMISCSCFPRFSCQELFFLESSMPIWH